MEHELIQPMSAFSWSPTDEFSLDNTYQMVYLNVRNKNWNLKDFLKLKGFNWWSQSESDMLKFQIAIDEGEIAEEHAQIPGYWLSRLINETLRFIEE